MSQSKQVQTQFSYFKSLTINRSISEWQKTGKTMSQKQGCQNDAKFRHQSPIILISKKSNCLTTSEQKLITQVIKRELSKCALTGFQYAFIQKSIIQSKHQPSCKLIQQIIKDKGYHVKQTSKSFIILQKISKENYEIAFKFKNSSRFNDVNHKQDIKILDQFCGLIAAKQIKYSFKLYDFPYQQAQIFMVLEEKSAQNVLYGLEIFEDNNMLNWLELVQKRCFDGTKSLSNLQQFLFIQQNYNQARTAASLLMQEIQQAQIISMKYLNFFTKLDIVQIKQQWDMKLKQNLIKIGRNWQIYQQKYHNLVINLFKIINFRFYDICEYLSIILNQFSTTYSLFKSQLPNFNSPLVDNQQQILVENQFDKIVKGYIKYRQTQEPISLKIPTYNLDAKLVKQLSGKQMNFDKVISKLVKKQVSSSKYQDFFKFFKNYFEVKEFKEKRKESDQILKKSQFLKEIHSQKLCNINCLGCTQFLYRDFNIIDNSLNKHDIKLYPKILEMKSEQSSIKQEISKMINSHGGIILFGCEQSGLEVLAKGEVLTQLNKEEIQQRIYSYINAFYPKIQIQHNIVVNFIPIAANPYKVNKTKQILSYQGSIQRMDQVYNRRPYYQGLYVTRVIVKPTDGEKVYFWKHPQDERIHVTDKINQKGLRKCIKRRFNQYNNSQGKALQQKLLGRNLLTTLNHCCKQPEKGLTIQYKEQKDKVQDLQQKYKHMSLLICKNENMQAVKKFLISNKINCELQICFTKYNFRPAKNTAILYHNQHFKTVLMQITNNSNSFLANKDIFLLSISPYLKLINRDSKNKLNKQQVKKIENVLHQQFPAQNLEYYEYTLPNSIKQYYFSTKTKRSNLFLYYYLNNVNQKVFFKSPSNFDQLKEHQKQERFNN